MSNDIAKTEEQKMGRSITPPEMLSIAVRQNADMDKLDKLMALQERWEANEARKAYVAAMTAFRQNPPTVLKDQHVKYGTTEYMHARLGKVVAEVGRALANYDFSHKWQTKQEDGLVTVTCTITHSMGHGESTSLSAQPDTSGGKNSIQAIGSAVSYLERYTFLAITGVVPENMPDTDGREDHIQRLNDDQVANIYAMLDEIGQEAKPGFMRYMQAETVEQIQAGQYQHAIAALKKKRASL